MVVRQGAGCAFAIGVRVDIVRRTLEGKACRGPLPARAACRSFRRRRVHVSTTLDECDDDTENGEDEEDMEPCPVDCVIEIETEHAFNAWASSSSDQPSCRKNTEWAILEVFSNSCRACLGMKRGLVKSCFGHNEVQFLTLNADVLPDIAKSLGVRGFPTFLVYRNGERVDHFNASSRKTLEEYLDTYVL